MIGIPNVDVGILTERDVSFHFNGAYRCLETGRTHTGQQHATLQDGRIAFESHTFDTLHFEPTDPSDSFDLRGVTIGVHFHWERREDQRFRGALILTPSSDGILVVNRIDVESYLESVISSEMSATSSPELLRAHAVISRSWLLAQIEKRQAPVDAKAESCSQDDEGLVRWYDREDHTRFDVCADDHCQRYQGITRATTPAVEEAVRATCGEVLTDEGRLCDTRFSKSCGGITECFEYCWEPVHHRYLVALRDSRTPDTPVPDLTNEAEADRWIRSAPEAFCHTTDEGILSQVLNNYDLETPDFYRWTVEYMQDELADLIRRKSGIDFGAILNLQAVERGRSGRIVRLRIVGSRRTYIIGKELEIRRTLSETHLYSSAFVVDALDLHHGVPRRFRLTGAGWGHGVGLCQIGAAVMGAEGHSYRAILSHYYPGSRSEIRYVR